MDIVVTGADEFATLARRLKEAGAKDLRRELYAGINRAVRPLTADVKNTLEEDLPGRYADIVRADFRVKTRRRGAGANPAIFLIGQAGNHDVRSLDRGRLRHPLFGNRRHWYNQQIPLGFWSQTLTRGAPRVRQELVEAIRKVAAKVEAGI